MFKYDPLLCWPSAKDLPDSDDTPVDDQLQLLIPKLLGSTLAMVWAERRDWFFGVNMGIYYHPEIPAIVPDCFLSIGVERVVDEGLRLSYVLWEEQKVPIFALEVVSLQQRGEYTEKKQLYTEMEILYYAIYHPFSRQKAPLEVYYLVNGEYVLLPGNRRWMPEIGLAIGTERGTYHGITREWLYWYNQAGEKFLSPEEIVLQTEQIAQVKREFAQFERQSAETERQRAETERQRAEIERQRAEIERQRAEIERQRAERLAEKLRALGIDPENVGIGDCQSLLAREIS
jgi:Uma2 family endonuclease